ncbi:hypothetical protein ACLK12_14025 [Escherichia coli]
MQQRPGYDRNFSVPALAFYLLAIIAFPGTPSPSAKPVGQRSLFACIGLALIAHASALGSEVLQSSGQNLSMLNVASLVSLIISCFMTCVTRRFNGWILLPVV